MRKVVKSIEKEIFIYWYYDTGRNESYFNAFVEISFKSIKNKYEDLDYEM